jgi:hypothetical protein
MVSFVSASRYITMLDKGSEALVSCLNIICDPDIVELVREHLDERKLVKRFPCRSLLERARVKLDVLAMLLRRVQMYVSYTQQVAGTGPESERRKKGRCR